MTMHRSTTGRGRPMLIKFRGEYREAREIAAVLGVTPQTVTMRVRRGYDLDAPKYQARVGAKNGAGRVIRRSQDILSDTTMYEDDERARHVLNYIRRGEPVHTVQEILEIIRPTYRSNPDDVTLEDALEARSTLTRLMCNGRHGTLEFIGEVMGVTRERVRQIENDGCKRLRESDETAEEVTSLRAVLADVKEPNHPLSDYSTQKAG